MKAKNYLHLLWIVPMSLAMGWFWIGTMRFSLWEATLRGPFKGTAYQGELSSNPTSVLKLAGGAQLEFHEISSFSAPVLVLKRDGKVEWQQVLVPVQRFSNGQQTTYSVSEARLRNIVVFGFTRGTKVRFTCYWTGGGYEAGVIYLKPDQSLDRFAISW